MVQPTQLTENTSDAPSSSSSSSFDDNTFRVSCLVHFVVGKTSRKYIGNGGLVVNDLVLTSREILKDFGKRTMDKYLYVHSTNDGSDENIVQVYRVFTSPDCGISIARVSTLLKRLY